MIRRAILVLIVGVGLVAIGSLFINRLRYPQQTLKSCFDNADGLLSGSPVRIAGVGVGIVRSVRANPQNNGCPAEVEMGLATTYELRIPKDSIAGIERAGVLGERYVSIDTSHASGAPSENYGYLKSKPSKPEPSLTDQIRAAELLLRLVQASKEIGKELPKDIPSR